MKIYPSLLTSSVEEFARQLYFVQQVPDITTIQVDVIDGIFADNLTISPADLIGFDFGELEIDFHFLTNEPLDFVAELVEYKEELPIRAVIGQVERMSSIDYFIEEAKVHKWQAGLSLDRYTPLSEVALHLAELDILQLMTIKSGFQGQEFQPNALKKIKELKKALPEEIAEEFKREKLEIIVDGGVKLEQLSLLDEAGIDSAVVGSGFWKTENPMEAMREYCLRAK